VFYDFGHNAELESVVRDIIAHQWTGRNDETLKFYIRYEDGDWEWRDWALCEELNALDEYLNYVACHPQQNCLRNAFASCATSSLQTFVLHQCYHGLPSPNIINAHSLIFIQLHCFYLTHGSIDQAYTFFTIALFFINLIFTILLYSLVLLTILTALPHQ